MALSAELAKQRYTYNSIQATVKVQLSQENGGYKISLIELHVELESPESDQTALQKCCETAKANCPVAKLYAGATITLNAQFK
jgi:osmotically inducible protein OsmC